MNRIHFLWGACKVRLVIPVGEVPSRWTFLDGYPYSSGVVHFCSHRFVDLLLLLLLVPDEADVAGWHAADVAAAEIAVGTERRCS